MGVIRRQGIKTSIVAYFGVLLGAVNTLWLYPRFLEASEIGLISLLTNVSLMIAPLAQMGVNGVILKYYPYVKNDKEKLGSFLYFIILIPTFGFLIAMLLLFLARNLVIEAFSENSSLFVDYLLVLVPFSFILVGRNIADAFSRAQLRVAMPKFFKEVILRVLIVIVVLVYSLSKLEQDFLIYGFVIAFGINQVLMLVYLRQLQSIKIKWSLRFLPKSMIKESLIYGMYIILSGFAGMIVTKIDSWMIASKLDLANTGIYTIALYIGLAIEMPKRSLNLISLPVVGKALKNNRIDEVEDLYKKSSLIQLIIGGLLFTCVWINIDSLFELIPNSETYAIGKYVVFFIGLAVLFDMATGINNEIILMSNFYKWNVVIMIILIVLAIINNEIFIPIYGINGAALATFISIIVFNIIKYLLVWKKLNIQPFTIKSLISLTIGLSLFGIGMILPTTQIPLVDIIYKSSLISAIYIFVHLRLGVSEDLNKLISLVLMKLKIKK